MILSKRSNMMAEDGRLTTNEAKESRKQWYSVREAAEYLAVSQPTIFRWMKEGHLSFYKVGGSTRFSQEGLDAVIEKTTGLKEAELIAGRCAACGHSVLVEGRIRGAGRLYFTDFLDSFRGDGTDKSSCLYGLRLHSVACRHREIEKAKAENN